MAYKIIFTARAERDIQAFLEDDRVRYTPAQQRAYVLEIRREIFALNPFPKRSTPKTIRGRKYRQIMHKAHTVFFRVIDAENTIYIDAVLHSSMNHQDHL